MRTVENCQESWELVENHSRIMRITWESSKIMRITKQSWESQDLLENHTKQWSLTSIVLNQMTHMPTTSFYLYFWLIKEYGTTFRWYPDSHDSLNPDHLPIQVKTAGVHHIAVIAAIGVHKSEVDPPHGNCFMHNPRKQLDACNVITL